jgi:hypothetical protein
MNIDPYDEFREARVARLLGGDPGRLAEARRHIDMDSLRYVEAVEASQRTYEEWLLGQPPAMIQDELAEPPFAGVAAEGAAVDAVEPVLVYPTWYPDDPHGAAIIHNYVVIDNAQARLANAHLIDLVGELRRSNEIAGELCALLTAEITAGRALLQADKANPRLLNILLKRSLEWLTDKCAGSVVGTIALKALEALARLTGLGW